MNPPEQVRVLLVEDNPLDARLIRNYLACQPGMRVEVEQVGRLSTGLDRLRQQSFDAVLLDLNLPDSMGLESVVLTHACSPRVPIVILTADKEDAVALRAVRDGAEDYLYKSELAPSLLGRSLRYAIDRAARREADDKLARALQESEAKLRSLFENLPDLVLLMSDSGRIEFANRAVPGDDDGSLGGNEGFGYVLPEFRGLCSESHRQARLTGGVQRLEVPDIWGNWWACRFVRISDNGLIDRVMAICTDITGQRKAELALGERDQRYRELLEAVHTYTYSVKLENGVPVSTDHSWGCLPVTGYTPEDYKSDPYLWIQMVHPDDREMVRRHVAAVLRGENVGSLEHRIYRRDGALRWLRDSVVLHHDGPVLVRYDGLVEDITARRVAEETLRERELQLAAAQRIQERLLPNGAPTIPGFDIAAGSYPAQYTAGDFYDYITLSNGNIGFVIGDVLGHGFSSALLMASTIAMVRLLAEIHNQVDRILEEANRYLVKATEDSFVTVLLAGLDPQSRSLVYASGGHPPGYVFDSAGVLKTRLLSTGMPLGIAPQMQFPAADPIRLESGDLVVLMTDGVQEAISPDKRLLGIDPVFDVVRQNRARTAAEIVERIRRLVCEFSQSPTPVDDLTAIVIKVC